MRGRLALLVVLLVVLLLPLAAWAGPVDWQEVPATEEGRQWWDAGSLRITRDGHLSVLSRFQPSEEGSRGQLYVMELDCDQELFRDTSVNGLPRFGAEWQAAAGDALSTSTLREACRAGTALLAKALDD